MLKTNLFCWIRETPLKIREQPFHLKLCYVVRSTTGRRYEDIVHC